MFAYWVMLIAYVYLFQANTRAVDQALEDEEITAQDFMSELNDEYNRRKNIETIAAWAYASNITDENEKLKNDVSAENAKYYKVSKMNLVLSFSIYIFYLLKSMKWCRSICRYL